MPKHYTLIASVHETVYTEQIVSGAEAQGLTNEKINGYMQIFYVFKLWDKIKILMVAFLDFRITLS